MTEPFGLAEYEADTFYILEHAFLLIGVVPKFFKINYQ
jgi:hypothetical protein